jgi:hypothetical protein
MFGLEKKSPTRLDDLIEALSHHEIAENERINLISEAVQNNDFEEVMRLIEPGDREDHLISADQRFVLLKAMKHEKLALLHSLVKCKFAYEAKIPVVERAVDKSNLPCVRVLSSWNRLRND